MAKKIVLSYLIDSEPTPDPNFSTTTTGEIEECDKVKEFECWDHSTMDPFGSSPKCIPISKKCDQVRDCSDGSDENPSICPEPGRCHADDWQCRSDDSECQVFEVHNARCLHALIPPPLCDAFECKDFVCLDFGSLGECLKTECKEWVCKKYSRNNAQTNNKQEQRCKVMEAKGLKYEDGTKNIGHSNKFGVTDFNCKEYFNPNEE